MNIWKPYLERNEKKKLIEIMLIIAPLMAALEVTPTITWMLVVFVLMSLLYYLIINDKRLPTDSNLTQLITILLSVCFVGTLSFNLAIGLLKTPKSIIDVYAAIVMVPVIYIGFVYFIQKALTTTKQQTFNDSSSDIVMKSPEKKLLEHFKNKFPGWIKAPPEGILGAFFNTDLKRIAEQGYLDVEEHSEQIGTKDDGSPKYLTHYNYRLSIKGFSELNDIHSKEKYKISLIIATLALLVSVIALFIQ